MSEVQIEALINALKTDTSLRARFQSAATLDDLVALAKEAGFVVTKSELLQAQTHTVELSDEELSGLAGGACSLPSSERVGWDGGC